MPRLSFVMVLWCCCHVEVIAQLCSFPVGPSEGSCRPVLRITSFFELTHMQDLCIGPDLHVQSTPDNTQAKANAGTGVVVVAVTLFDIPTSHSGSAQSWQTSGPGSHLVWPCSPVLRCTLCLQHVSLPGSQWLRNSGQPSQKSHLFVMVLVFMEPIPDVCEVIATWLEVCAVLALCCVCHRCASYSYDRIVAFAVTTAIQCIFLALSAWSQVFAHVKASPP